MDHVINGIKSHLEIELDELAFEVKMGKYPNLSDCPSYPACKAMVDAIHILEKYNYGEHKTESVKVSVSWRI